MSAPRGLVVDLFAGGGGASIGIEAAIGRSVDIAINHSAEALAVHQANHPETRHLTADIWEVRPQEATGGQPVDLLWASPDCTHFSAAKGGKPRKQNIRSLAWVVIRWAQDVRPKVIFLENVSEFRGWGPLGKDGQPDKSRMGETFRRWLKRLENLGYEVEYRVLDASLYGAPTRRRRLFLVARCDGQPIQWPEPTHGPGRLPFHTAAECIDWSIPCPSIFERSRPLAEKTLWRIAQGIRRFVLESPRPFIVRYNGGLWRGQGTGEPLTTLDTSNRFGVVAPIVAGVGGRSGQSPATPGDAPLGTVTAKNDRALIVPSLVEMNADNAPHGATEPLGTVTTQHNRFNLLEPRLEAVPTFEEWFADTRNYGGSRGEYDRIYGAEPPDGDDDEPPPAAEAAPVLVKFRGDSRGARLTDPLPTVTAGGQERPGRPATGNPLGLLMPSIVKVNHGKDEARGEALDAPLSTVTATQRGHAIVAPHLVKVNHGDDEKTGRREHSLEDPLTTLTAGGNGHALIAPTLIQTGYGEREGQRPRSLDIQQPLGTAVAGGQKHAVIAAHLSRQFGQGVGSEIDEPAPTVMPAGAGKSALVSAFLAKHYGGVVGQEVEQPAATITATDHHALAAATLVKLRGECAGADVAEPAPTITAAGFHIGEVRAFLTAYYDGEDGTSGQAVLEPMRTLTAKHRLGLVTVEGAEYQIVDIGMRMLEPHELLAAQFGRFAEFYDMSAAPTKAGKVRLIGNSVCPEMAEALVKANVAVAEEREVA